MERHDFISTPNFSYGLRAEPALNKYRNSDGEFMVAVDGVHLYTKKGRHPNAVYKKIGGKISSYYHALEAKLVTSDGMGFPMTTVFIENEEEYVKQDCELKAFCRLAEVLKERFPRMRICLLLDGPCPNRKVLDICEKNQWGHSITLKDGCIPLLRGAADEQIKYHPEQSVDHSPEAGVYQHLSWALNMKHEGRRTHVLICRETRITGDGIEATVLSGSPIPGQTGKMPRNWQSRRVIDGKFKSGWIHPDAPVSKSTSPPPLQSQK